MNNCYIIDMMEASNACYDHDYAVYSTLEEAKERMSEFVKQKMEEYEYSDEEIAQCYEVNDLYDYFEGLDGEWVARISMAENNILKNEKGGE